MTGYQWLVAQPTNGNLTDNAQGGLINFTITPPPIYPVITNPPVDEGSCFHLTHAEPLPQWLRLNEILLPSANTVLSFRSLLGYATTNEVARVQISTNGGTIWQDIFTQAGNGGLTETSFDDYSIPLGNFAGQPALLRFNFDYNPVSGSYYPQTYNVVGWSLEDIAITNTLQLVNVVTNITATPYFNFTPMNAGDYTLIANGMLYSQYPLDFGPVKNVTATTNSAPTILTLGKPQLLGMQLAIPFMQTQGVAATFKLLQAYRANGPWLTNTNGVLSTNLPGCLYQFTTPVSGTNSFYRVRSP